MSNSSISLFYLISLSFFPFFFMFLYCYNKNSVCMVSWLSRLSAEAFSHVMISVCNLYFLKGLDSGHILWTELLFVVIKCANFTAPPHDALVWLGCDKRVNTRKVINLHDFNYNFIPIRAVTWWTFSQWLASYWEQCFCSILSWTRTITAKDGYCLSVASVTTWSHLVIIVRWHYHKSS